MEAAEAAEAARSAGPRLETIAGRPELWRPFDDLCGSVWAEIMLHDEVAHRCWGHLRDVWPQFQLVLLDGDAIVAGANAAPIQWDGNDEGLPEGWDDQFERSISDLAASREPNTLGALQIVVAPVARGRGLSAVVLDALFGAARAAGFGAVIACVRPTDKGRYPLMSIDDYAAWRRPDGLPYDPWLRVHVRAGGRVVRPSPASMTIEGTVAEASEWTGLEFPVSGPYVVEGTLEPVRVDLEAGRAVYHDPNIWVIHHLG